MPSSPPSMSTGSQSVSITCTPAASHCPNSGCQPSWSTCQVHLAFISAGSKNPKIALKLAEFQTDSQGKVSVAGVPGRSVQMRRGGRGLSWEIRWPLTPHSRSGAFLAN